MVNFISIDFAVLSQESGLYGDKLLTDLSSRIIYANLTDLTVMLYPVLEAGQLTTYQLKISFK